MENSFKLPFYAKTALIFICIFATVFILHIGQTIIVPLLYSAIIAILLNPLVNRLTRKGMNKTFAISIALLLATLFSMGILYVVSSQIDMFREAYPQLKAKFNSSSAQFAGWLSGKFDVRVSKINAWTVETRNEAIDNLQLGQSLGEAGQMLVNGLLLPVYVFMILYYKTLLLEFTRKLFRAEHHVAVAEVLVKTKTIIQTYLVGLFFEIVIVAVLNSAGLLLLGIDYAIILGITGALLNIIPYVGGIVATILPMIIAFVTKDSLTYPLLVFVVYILVQFIDNNYIVPKIVAARVKINALISVIVVLLGGALWGVSGMFLSIPLTAILKVVFDHIDPLKPWGFLLGNIVPTSCKFSFIKLRNL